MALRAAVLRHLRVLSSKFSRTCTQIPAWSFFGSVQLMSSHNEHLTKEQVIDRALDVVKSFPKVDPSRVSLPFFVDSTTLSTNTMSSFMESQLNCLILWQNQR